MARLAVDFGTSNTGAALPGGCLVALERGEATIPTAVFFDPHDGSVLFGNDAVGALIEGREGRFLRALKSVLGHPLLREKRVLGGARTTLLDVVARYLAEVKARAEAQAGARFDAVLSGRPVRFHSRDDARNAQAAVDLEEAYRRAGFDEVAFLAEPEAAALASGAADAGVGLVVDIGGGTSDYTVFRGNGGEIEPISSHGIRLGGTDFDRLLNIDRVQPLLGLGTLIRNELGEGRNEAPRALFHDLATWEKIPFQYTGQIRRDVAQMARLADEPEAWERLGNVLEMELAHEIAHAVERGKIAVNGGDARDIGLGFVEPGLAAPLSASDLARVLGPQADEIGEAALEAVRLAGVGPGDVARVVMVGGSSLMRVVEKAVRDRLPLARIERREAFTAIIDGLAIAAANME